MTDHHTKAVNEFTAEDGFFGAIGRFIFEFSQLECSFKVYIAEEIRLEDEYFNVIMTHDFALLCTIAEAVLIRAVSEEQVSNLKKLIKRCKGLNDHRVRIVHGLWFIGGKEGRLIRASKGKTEAKLYYKQAHEVASLADKANQCRWELQQMVYGPSLPRRARTRQSAIDPHKA